MTQVLRGVAHGKLIELERDIGVPEGQEVEMVIRSIPPSSKTEPWGEGLRRCDGALAGIPGLDEDMEQILQARKAARFREVPE